MTANSQLISQMGSVQNSLFEVKDPGAIATGDDDSLNQSFRPDFEQSPRR
jgi:hypothetical protein